MSEQMQGSSIPPAVGFFAERQEGRSDVQPSSGAENPTAGVAPPEVSSAPVAPSVTDPADAVAAPVDRSDPTEPFDPSGLQLSADPDRRLLAGRRPGSPARKGKRLVRAEEAASATRSLTPEQKLLILDAWQRSSLPAKDFAPVAGVSRQTLYAWKRRFQELGPAGLVDEATTRGPRGSKLPESTKRAIVMLKKDHPEWGCQRISDVLYRGPGLAASAGAVARVLKEQGYALEESPTRPHKDHVRGFERARPNQLWQTDLFTFILKRQNRRIYMVAFMDDHSRYITGYGLHVSQNAALVIEVFRAGVIGCGTPEEVLTDNGAQYVTWRGTSMFAKELQKRGIKHIVSAPQHPRTLGKIERFWGTLWRECIETSVFLDLEDARKRVGLFIDHYNFQRTHSSLGGLAPADRFFGAAPQMLETLKARVQGNSLELARNGTPRAPFYLTGQVGGKSFSVHAEGERLFMLTQDGGRQEIDLHVPAASAEEAEVRAAVASAKPQTQAAVAVPDPVCSVGVVTRDYDDEGEPEPGGPGTSRLDAQLDRLDAALNAATSVAPIAAPNASGGTGGAGGTGGTGEVGT